MWRLVNGEELASQLRENSLHAWLVRPLDQAGGDNGRLEWNASAR